MSRPRAGSHVDDQQLAREIEALLQVEPPPALEGGIRHRIETSRVEPPRGWAMVGLVVPAVALAAAFVFLVSSTGDDSIERRPTPAPQQAQWAMEPAATDTKPTESAVRQPSVTLATGPSSAWSHRIITVDDQRTAVPAGLIPGRETVALHAYLGGLAGQTPHFEPAHTGGAHADVAHAEAADERAVHTLIAEIAIVPLEIQPLGAVVPLSGEAE